ncbi:unnamed protein product [Spirodela intermedia]|uniref:Uncharacterized protein n=1 Tax=Spirodela intermedia TaxID=51605 RepID=A0A7I8KJS1_SPIIN|nr:unnamed protein product [Spirodela intermedia]
MNFLNIYTTRKSNNKWTAYKNLDLPMTVSVKK